MKRIFVVMMVICLMATVLCVPAFAADASAEETTPPESTESINGAFIENDKVYWTMPGGWGDYVYYSGSIFSQGSLTMIVAITALVASAVSICLTVTLHKKNTLPKATSESEEKDD